MHIHCEFLITTKLNELFILNLVCKNLLVAEFSELLTHSAHHRSLLLSLNVIWNLVMIQSLMVK